MSKNVAKKLIEDHLISGDLKPGSEIGLKIDQTLTQDATGTLVMLEFEAMKIPKVKTELSAQYVDHNLIQQDFKNPDDHKFLMTACKKFGVWFSPPGNGVSHPVHMERFGIPGKTLLGSDSHTCAAGSLGMLAIGAGGLEVAMAMAGEPFFVKMPKVLGVELTGSLPDWVSAKDIILEALRRRGVKGGVGMIVEYYGDGLENLSAMDRHVIANMGAELGATTTIFPSDKAVKKFLKSQGRAEDYIEILPDKNAEYDEYEKIDLSKLEPMIALPSSPGNVRKVREVAGKDIYQSYIGSSANPGMRDFAVPALMLKDRGIAEGISLDINPTSRQILENLTEKGYLGKLIRAGARIHQAGCNGCIGMGQAPATDGISLRTVPRNFPGRSGTKEDKVYLCSPETAVASAIRGKITDPRDLDFKYPKFEEPEEYIVNTDALKAPARDNKKVEIIKGPNIKELPDFKPIKKDEKLKTIIKVGDDISTDEIMPAGSNVLPFRSNIFEISKFVYSQVDDSFYDRAMKYKDQGSVIVGGENYGQGSSREHAAIAPRYLGVKIVIAKSYARIHWQNLVNFGILPLVFSSSDDYAKIKQEDVLIFSNVHDSIKKGKLFTVKNSSENFEFECKTDLSERQKEVILEGGLINLTKKRRMSGD